MFILKTLMTMNIVMHTVNNIVFTFHKVQKIIKYAIQNNMILIEFIIIYF